MQIIPHLTDEIKRRMCAPEAQIIINEIGGSCGDIEGLPFLEAIRQMQAEQPENVIVLHLTLIVHLKAAGEVKTKPTQHAVAKLREIGIIPDFLLCRSEVEIEQDALNKLSLFCDVKKENVIPIIDSETVYEVPLRLYDFQLDVKALARLRLNVNTSNIKPWTDLVHLIHSV